MLLFYQVPQGPSQGQKAPAHVYSYASIYHNSHQLKPNRAQTFVVLDKQQLVVISSQAQLAAKPQSRS